MMILKIAWKNIWRNKLRSIVVILAVAIGVFASMILFAFNRGVSNQRVKFIIRNYTSHIKIHHKKFPDNQEVQFFIPNLDKVENAIKQNSQVKAYAKRWIIVGMFASAKTTRGGFITGMDIEKEKKVSDISKQIVEGTFFRPKTKNQIIVGKTLLEKLDLKLNSKVILTFMLPNGEITSVAFKIVGVYKTTSSKYDESQVFVKNRDLEKITNVKKKFHEIAIILNNRDNAETVKADLVKKINADKILIETWKELSPEIRYLEDSAETYLYIFVVIILIAVAFGIINTMLMAVLERTRELGMLMAIGMNKIRVFFMIMLETIMLTMLGVPLGALIALAVSKYFETYGLDLSAFSQGLESFGFDTMIYTTIQMDYFIKVIVMVFVTAVLSAIYPAWNALKLKPVDAIRKF